MVESSLPVIDTTASEATLKFEDAKMYIFRHFEEGELREAY